MASATLTLTGLEALKAALRQLPARLAGRGADIVERRGARAVAVIRAGYPSRTGDLQRKLSVTHTRSRFGARAVVKNTAKIAVVFDRGSEARHYMTRRGVKHLTGKAPANPIFAKTMRQERRAMYEDLRAVLVSEGLTVTGDGG